MNNVSSTTLLARRPAFAARALCMAQPMPFFINAAHQGEPPGHRLS
jgi:hypothetical protein